MALLFDSTNGFRDTGTGALTLPQGTTAQRPSAPVPGMMRYNTDLQVVEMYGNTANGVSNTSWSAYSSGNYTAQVLLVAGGGAGSGGGGGAGGLLFYNSVSLQAGESYWVSIGAGGTSGGSGYNTTFNGLTAIGGGGPGAPGGSGGGTGWGGQHQWGAITSGVTGQGNNGGTGYYHSDWGHSYGGGGGAGAAGGWGAGSAGNQSGNGGNGLAYSINGTSTYYAGGGGGSQGGRSWYGPGGAGGGGGANGQAGGSNLGAGGNSNNGGSGIVIITYYGNQRASGGIVTQSGGYTSHTFLNSAYYFG